MDFGGFDSGVWDGLGGVASVAVIEQMDAVEIFETEVFGEGGCKVVYV